MQLRERDGQVAAGLRPFLDVVDLGEGRWSAPAGRPAVPGLTAVPGTQLLAQIALVATRVLPVGPLRSLHTVFSRPVPLDRPHVLAAEVLASGSSAGSARLQVLSDGAPCVSATALALAPQPIEPAHAVAPPDAVGVEQARPLPSRLPGLEQRSADGVDVLDPESALPPRALVWLRAVGAPPDAGAAALAYATEPLLMGPSLLPHPGWSVRQAFSRFSAAVVSHSLWCHASLQAGDWWLLDVRGEHLAGGRAFNRADVFSEDGALLASVAQEGLLRPLGQRHPEAHGG